MTQRNRWFVNSLAVVCGMTAIVLGLGRCYDIGRAEARGSFVAQAETVSPDALPVIPPPPPGSLGDVPALDAGAGSAMTLPEVTAQPAPAQSAEEPATESWAWSLWRSGAFTSAGIVLVYVLLTYWRKHDKRRAFYISAALGGVDMLFNCVIAGSTPTAPMMMAAVSTILAILARGPEKKDVTEPAPGENQTPANPTA